MFNSSANTSRPWHSLAKHAGTATRNILSAGLAAVSLFAASAEIVSASAHRLTEPLPEARAIPSTALAQSISDGVYLYGQSRTAEQLGAAYMVFEVNQGKLVGAFYMPHSSFDCFRGTVEADRVALNVIDSYAQTAHPFDVAMEASATVATVGSGAIAPPTLEGFHRIETVSQNDQRILSTCKANYQSEI